MSDDHKDIHELYQLLKSKNESDIFNGLKTLKHRFIKDIGKITPLKELRVVTAVLSLLRNASFTNLCLSIIADACVNGDYLDEIFANDGVASLVSILESSSNNEFKSRACRALGNIGKCHTGYAEILKKTPVLHILRFLSESNNMQSQLVSLRTLRILGVNTKAQNLIANDGGLFVIGNLLISENESVVLNSLKTLICLTHCNEICSSTLLEKPFLENIKDLFSRSKLSIQTHILILIKQLSVLKNKHRKNNLKCVGFVQICCDVAHRSMNSYEMREAAVMLLCNCLDISHSWDKQSDNLQYHILETLTEVLNANLFKVVHMYVLTSVVSLFSDDAFSEVFLKLNFIDALIIHLNIFISNNKCLHVVKDLSELNSKSRFADAVEVDEMESYFPPIELGHSSTSLSASVHPDAGNPNPADLRAYDSSATSQSNCRRSIEDAKTDSGQSLASVNVMSVSSSESDSGPESGSDDCDNASKLNCHKPVRESKKRHCFYVPPGGSRFDRTSSGAYGAKKQKLDIVRQRSKHSKSCGCKEEETVNIDEPILFMILQLSHFYIRMFNSPFARNNVFSVLLDYISSVSVPHERASLILAAILKNELNFKTLIVNGFIEELDEKMHVLHDLRCCYRCYNLQKIHQQIIESCRFLVEKDFIRQTLYGLLRSNECDIKLHAMYAISRLVIDKYALLDILYTKNAIQVIFSSLCSESKTEQEKALVCICEIYKNTSSEKKRRIAEFHPNKSKIPVFCQAKKNPTCSFEGDYELDVEFLLDCGTKVLACRGKMSEQSDYFRALLSGYFSEGKSKLIQLPNITKNALSVILHFLHGCGDQGYCPYFDKIPMKLLLELLAKSEEFLLFSLKTRVEKNLASYLSHKTVVNIYRSGKLHNSSNLCDKTIDYLLTLDTLNKKAFPKPFNELMCQEFINDLKSFVNDHLKVPVPSVETKSEKIFLKYI